MIKSIFSENYIQRNSFRAWVLAARPKTLTGAAVPVILGGACAWSNLNAIDSGQAFGIVPFVLCLLFAFVMQINANFVNDYFDCVKGKDNEKRLGPKRACQQGWVTLNAMRYAIALTTLVACGVGLPLVYYGGMEMLAVGALCVLFCFLYTTIMASIGLGDLLVLVFFGIVPTMCTWWVVLPHEVAFESGFLVPFLLSVACGLIVDTLLIINNYRDLENDREVGKKTLAVMIGKKNTEWLYIVLPTISIVIVLFVYGWTSVNMILMFGVYFLYTGTWNEMRAIGHGKELNKVLGKTARNIFAFGILVSLLVIL